MAVTTRHDGTGACRAHATSVRVVCGNTFSMAEAERDGVVFLFGHDSTWRDRSEEARQAVRGLRKDFHDYTEFATELASVKVTKRQREIFVTEFIPAPLEAAAVSNRVLGNIERAREAVREILASPTTEAVNGTAFGLVQGTTEYLDHVRGYRSKDTYMGPAAPQAREAQAGRRRAGDGSGQRLTADFPRPPTARPGETTWGAEPAGESAPAPSQGGVPMGRLNDTQDARIHQLLAQLQAARAYKLDCPEELRQSAIDNLNLLAGAAVGPAAGGAAGRTETGGGDVIAIVTRDEHTTHQDEIEVPDGLAPCEISALAEERAREGGGFAVSAAEPDVVDWVIEGRS